MESTNVSVDDSCDFFDFSKENVLSSLIEETSEEVAADQSIATQELIPTNLLQ